MKILSDLETFFHLFTFFQIYGDGSNTRSFQYVSDLVDGLIKLMNSNYTGPVNIGNPIEHTIQGKIIFSDTCGLFVSFMEKSFV